MHIDDLVFVVNRGFVCCHVTVVGKISPTSLLVLFSSDESCSKHCFVGLDCSVRIEAVSCWPIICYLVVSELMPARFFTCMMLLLALHIIICLYIFFNEYRTIRFDMLSSVISLL